MKMLRALTTSSLLFSVTSFAGNSGSILYGPSDTPALPTLSTTMIVVMALLMAVVAYRTMRNRQSGTPLSLLVALLVAGSLGYGGNTFISDAIATASQDLELPGGGKVPIFDNQLNTFANTSGISQKIEAISIQAEACGGFPLNAPGECAVGLVIPPNESCFIECRQVSDMRLKRNITLLSELDNGLKMYSFKYNWGEETYVGVMAQDLLEDSRYNDAVVKLESGYYGVDYARLGLQMQTLAEWNAAK